MKPLPYPHSVLCCFLLMLCCTHASAQLHWKANLQNMHLWRGMEVTDGLVLTTDLSISDPKQYVRFGLWGGTNLQGTYKEFNYYLAFTYQRLRLEVWDIFNFSPGATYNNREIFNYKPKETGRFIDATLSYTVSQKVPLYLSWSTILYGRDRDSQNAHNRYSTFVYLDYPVFRNEKWEVKPGIGGAFAFNSGKEADGKPSTAHFYGEKPGIVHVSLATTYFLTIVRYAMPITLMALWNPQSNQGHLQIGIQLFSF